MTRGRRLAIAASTAAAAAVLGVAGFAWACVSTSGPSATATPNRQPLGEPLTVSGASWQPATAVSVGLSPDGSRVTQPLASVPTDAGGAFSVLVRPTGVEPGVAYLTVSQGEVHKNIPVEFAAARSADAAVVVTGPGAASAGDDLSSGFATAPATPAQGLADLDAESTGGGSNPAAVGLVAALAATAAGLALVEVRRRRAEVG